ncbi:putative Phosphatidylglycerophosphatase and protein-tyrosine phosphatase 1 [Hypsibius exemplaris]|uniref:Phosphatidylglycerophosphatase and protein-tyrosine phosphatase 1 n=1 Tax=Hypsibius exemplaris TaxID=2072580 RepID=A0A1W0X8V6_HYPEX|nr:putative Phosphatidylglycerophosphatase and protein-tyrosine phosphatase 1 [Hypsibius exemplaris]
MAEHPQPPPPTPPQPPPASKTVSNNSLPSLGRQVGSMFRKALFFPSLAYNVISEKFTARTWYNHIDETVILGALPFRSVMQTLVDTEKVKGIISFNEDYEVNPLWYPSLEEMEHLGVGFLRLPVEDYTSTPTSEQVSLGLHFIEDVKERGGCVYIHCKAGRFRSAYFAAAYVIATQRLSGLMAVEMVHSKRPQIWLGSRQIRKLQEFHNALYPSEPEVLLTEEAPSNDQSNIPQGPFLDE